MHIMSALDNGDLIVLTPLDLSWRPPLTQSTMRRYFNALRESFGLGVSTLSWFKSYLPYCPRYVFTHLVI